MSSPEKLEIQHVVDEGHDGLARAELDTTIDSDDVSPDAIG